MDSVQSILWALGKNIVKSYVHTMNFMVLILYLDCVGYFRAGEKITVTPSSKEFLFYPPEVEATITGG